MKIVPLDKENLPLVKQICDQQLGDNYISIQDFEQLISNDNSFVSVVIESEKVIGFSVCEIEPKDTFIEKHLKEYSLAELPEEISKSVTIGIINTIAIEEAYKRRGLATLLFESANQLITDAKVDSICAFAWNSKEGVKMEKILKSVGYQEIKELKNYWYNSSLEEQFDCADCGNPPCKCSAVLYCKFTRIH